jgi:hypothetical protein
MIAPPRARPLNLTAYDNIGMNTVEGLIIQGAL